MDVTCPSCGRKCDHKEIEEKREEETPLTVARRETGFSGNVTSLTSMGGFAFMVEMPCGCEVITVN